MTKQKKHPLVGLFERTEGEIAEKMRIRAILDEVKQNERERHLNAPLTPFEKFMGMKPAPQKKKITTRYYGA